VKVATFSIDYDEPKQSTYRGVVVSIRNLENKDPWKNRKEHRFNTGYPPLDLVDAHNFLVGVKDLSYSSWSSSVDHFTMDGDRYAWYENEDGEWLKASDSFKKTKAYQKIKAKILKQRKDVTFAK